MTLLGLLVAVIIIGIVFVLLARYVAPTLGDPWGKIMLALAALIVIVWLLGTVGWMPRILHG